MPCFRCDSYVKAHTLFLHAINGPLEQQSESAVHASFSELQNLQVRSRQTSAGFLTQQSAALSQGMRISAQAGAGLQVCVSLPQSSPSQHASVPQDWPSIAQLLGAVAQSPSLLHAVPSQQPFPKQGSPAPLHWGGCAVSSGGLPLEQPAKPICPERLWFCPASV
jgi:hypothetical protein